MCLEFQAIQQRDKPVPPDKPDKPWEAVGADIYMPNNKTYLCTVDYHSKFSVVKQMDGLRSDSLIKTCKVICSQYGPLRKIRSVAGTNSVAEIVLGILQVHEYPPGCIIIKQPSEQWVNRGMQNL